MTSSRGSRRSPGQGLALVGHSGVEVTLIRTLHGTVVRKQSVYPRQNERLKAQANKLLECARQGLPCPAILELGMTDDLVYFDMEYIPGETLANAVLAGRQLDWHRVIDQIVDIVVGFRASQSGVFDAAVFRTKLDAIGAACGKAMQDGGISRAIDRTIGRLWCMNWDDVGISACHGDLTFENILVKLDETLVYIDFDVPEQSSWMLDVGKLYQDLLGHWCLRHIAPASASVPIDANYRNANLRLDQLARQLSDRIRYVDSAVEARGRQFAAFHLLRTLPYATDRDMVLFVLRRIDILLDG